jgi:hypothetical protein
MRMPEAGPFGDTRFDASALAIVLALFVNSPVGGWVESVVTPFTQRREPDRRLDLAVETLLFLALRMGQKVRPRQCEVNTQFGVAMIQKNFPRSALIMRARCNAALKL